MIKAPEPVPAKFVPGSGGDDPRVQVENNLKLSR